MAIAASVSVLLLVILVLWALVAVYVWRDAGRRGMNRALWTIVVLLTPYFVGLIIYLIARSGRTDYQCSQCGKPVELSFDRCPYCGTRLRGSCSGCGREIEPDWKVCPYCGHTLSADPTVHPPVRKKDRLWLVLVAVLLVPVSLILFLAAGHSVQSNHSTAASERTEGLFASFSQLPSEALAEEPEVQHWYEEALSGERDADIYVLEFETEERHGGVLLFTGDAEGLCLVSCALAADSMDGVTLTVGEGTSEESPGVWVFWYEPAGPPFEIVGTDLSINWTVTADHSAVQTFCEAYSTEVEE